MGTFKVKSVSTGREGEGNRGKEEIGRGEGREGEGKATGVGKEASTMFSVPP